MALDFGKGVVEDKDDKGGPISMPLQGPPLMPLLKFVVEDGTNLGFLEGNRQSKGGNNQLEDDTRQREPTNNP